MRAPLLTLLLILGLPVLAGCQLALPGRVADAGSSLANPVTLGAVQVTSLDAPKPGVATAVPATAAAPAVPLAAPAVPAAVSAAPAQGAATPLPAARQATSPPPEVTSIPISPQALECKSTGGIWGKVGNTVAYSCFRQTRDAGKSCRRETDCETECLARSRTCAPITPMIGCNPVLQADGREVTLCID